MAQKILISFLGTTSYANTEYYLHGNETQTRKTCYVQEAIFELDLSKEWQESDRVFIFTTEKAKENNYDNRLTQNLQRGIEKEIIEKVRAEEWESVKELKQKLDNNPKSEKEQDGLKHRLDDLGIHNESVSIPNNTSTPDSIGKILHSLQEKIGEDTELYVDITNGFRFMPMLATAIIQYVTTLKKVTLKKVYYGNFEQNHKQPPILTLTSLVDIGKWAQAVAHFERGGDAQYLKDLLTERLSPEKNLTLGEALYKLTQDIKTCRGKNLIENDTISLIRQRLDSDPTETLIAPLLKPLKERIKEKIKNFNDNSIHNGFAAVQWCIDHQQVQQGYTLLQETVISWFIEENDTREKLENYDSRKLAKDAFQRKNVPKDSNYKDDEVIKNKLIYWNKYKAFLRRNKYSGLTEAFINITNKDEGGLRNDINHAGFSATATTPLKLTHKLKELYTEATNIIKPSYLEEKKAT